MAGKVCPMWLASGLENRLRGMLHKPEMIMGDYVKPGYTVVDIGCGPGYFSTALAEMVGEEGRVIAVDLQPAMLDRLRLKAEGLNLQSRIILHQCLPDRLGIREKVDFVLAFWMVHEVTAPDAFFGEITAMLKPNGYFLMVEPKMHVSASSFRDLIGRACRAGLSPQKEVKVAMSRGVLFLYRRG